LPQAQDFQIILIEDRRLSRISYLARSITRILQATKAQSRPEICNLWYVLSKLHLQLNSTNILQTAGRGIVHAEMPRQNADGSPNVGMQLWVDLPKALKMCEPRYRDLRASEIPDVTLDEGKVNIKVISGQSHGVDSVKELAYTPVWLLDVTIKPGGKVVQPLPAGWNSFAYTISGTVQFGKDAQTVEQYHNTVFEQKGDSVVASVKEDAKEESRFILVAGLPLDQKIVQYGPFVLTKEEDIYEALKDYQTHSNGFERARDWESEIGKSMVH
jgi:redox-sensitive bicupin YhaK (pirin superfamily)